MLKYRSIDAGFRRIPSSGVRGESEVNDLQRENMSGKIKVVEAGEGARAEFDGLVQ